MPSAVPDTEDMALGATEPVPAFMVLTSAGGEHTVIINHSENPITTLYPGWGGALRAPGYLTVEGVEGASRRR